MKRILVYFILINFFTVCSQNKIKKRYSPFENFINKYKIDSTFHTIFILNEHGCLSCLKTYWNLCKKNFNTNDTYIIISNPTNKINYFDTILTSKICFDTFNYSVKFNLTSSYYIHQSNNKIDTVITLNADSIEIKINNLLQWKQNHQNL